MTGDLVASRDVSGRRLRRWSLAVAGILLLVVAAVVAVRLAGPESSATAEAVWTVDQTSSPYVPLGVWDGTLLFDATDAVHAVDFRTGAQRWTLDGDPRVPQPQNGLVYLSQRRREQYSGTQIAAGAVQWRGVSAVEIATGTVRWRSEDFPGEFHPGGDTGYVVTTDGQVIGLDARTGTVLWRFAAGKPDPPPTPAGRQPVPHVWPSPRAAAVYVIGLDGRLVALDERSGHTRWELPGVGHRWGSAVTPADTAETVYAVNDTGIVALDAATGRQLWTRPARGDWLEGRCVTVVGGTAYILGRDTLDALDAATAAPRWSVPVPPASGHLSAGDRTVFPCTPTLVDAGAVYATPEKVVALDVATGARRWIFDVNADEPPLLVGGRLYVMYDTGSTHHLAVVDPRTGRQIWRWTPQQVERRLAVPHSSRLLDPGDGLLIYTCPDCTKTAVFALRAPK